MHSKTSGELWLRIMPDLNEAQRRWLAGAKVLELGWGGLAQVQKATNLSAPTIIKGIKEVQSKRPLNSQERIRTGGGGRKSIEFVEPEILRTLERILDENTAGDPMSHLRWTHKSTRTLSEEMSRKGYNLSHTTIARLLADLEYSLQANAKTKEGRSPPERDRQFRYINDQVTKFQDKGNPVLSIDTKKKEKVGCFKNSGQTYRPKGNPIDVNIYDFPTLGKGIAIPYGAYDVQLNRGFVNVGMSHDTAEFAVNSLRWWWRRYGHRYYPDAIGWLLCADGGGSNGSRNHAWKYHLQELSNELNIPVTICHYPPGTSKWNKIEHRMFSFISTNWQGIPLESYATVIKLIGGTKTKGGLKVNTRLDKKKYVKGKKISEADMSQISICPHTTNPQWNYTIMPQNGTKKRRVRKS